METRSNHVLVGSVTLALLAGLLMFIVWLAGLSAKAEKCFDIYFSQGVGDHRVEVVGRLLNRGD